MRQQGLSVNEDRGIRLNKFISDSGFCSRREADRCIEDGLVSVDGCTAETGTRVFPGTDVRVEGRRIRASASNKSDRVYIAYNKPVGITCTTERGVPGNIVDAIGHHQRIFPIGRLDKPSEGLIFLTSDGDIVNKILRAENAHDKEYVVTVDKPLTSAFVDKMSSGIPILGTVTKPCQVSIQSRFVFKVILTQGLNRQIRRMCEYLGYEVTKLKRSRIMNVELGKLKPGEWRNLLPREMDDLNQAVAGSSSAAEESGSSARTSPHRGSRGGDASVMRAKSESDRRGADSAGRSKQRAAKSSRGGQARGQDTHSKDDRGGRSKLAGKPAKTKTATNRTAKLSAAKKKSNKKQAAKTKR